MNAITLRHGIESCAVATQSGKTLADHITAREKQFLGLPEKYVLLCDGEKVNPDSEYPENGNEYTIEALAPDKAATAKKPVKGK